MSASAAPPRALTYDPLGTPTAPAAGTIVDFLVEIAEVCRDYADRHDCPGAWSGRATDETLLYHARRRVLDGLYQTPSEWFPALVDAARAAEAAGTTVEFTFDDDTGIGTLVAAGTERWHVILPHGRGAEAAQRCADHGTDAMFREDLEQILALREGQADIVVKAHDNQAWIYEAVPSPPLSDEDCSDFVECGRIADQFDETNWDYVTHVPWPVLNRHLRTIGLWELSDAELGVLSSFLSVEPKPKLEALVHLVTAAYS